ncbi:MAG: acyltransferase [bacterium]|nr:acyltransferase [bacterium]
MSSDDFQRRAFENMIEGNPMPFGHMVRLGGIALLDPFRLVANYMPGPAGYAIRRILYRWKLKSLGKNCILDVGLRIAGAENISIGDYTWIDAYTTIYALFGPIKIGKRIHISPSCVINTGPEGVEIQDYVGVATGCHIYGHTEMHKEGKRISGPMIPWRYKGFHSARVVLEKDSFLGANCVVLPGVTIGEGAVVGAGSIVNKDIPPWSIAVGSPLRVIRKRDKVTVPDL